MNHKHIALLSLLALAPISIAHAQETTTTTDTTTTDTTTTTTDTVSSEPPAETTTTTTTTSVDSEVAASADTVEPPPSSSSSSVSPPTVLISIRGGVFVPQVFNRLDTSFTVGLGVGYVLPFLDYRVAIVLDAFYTRPERQQLTLMDPRLPGGSAGGSYSYNMVQNDISMFIGFLVHFTDLARDLIIPYAGLGARVHFLWSDIDGNSSGGQVLGSHRETSTQGGGAIRVGCGIRVGPGMIALDLELGLAPLDHLITGGSNIGNLAVSAGYTLIL